MCVLYGSPYLKSFLLYCSLAIVVESMNITIAYTIGVYMVRNLLQDSADQSTIATLTGLLVRVLSQTFLC